MSEQMTAADALVRVLAGEGVEVVFGIPGSHILPTFDALARHGRIKVVLARHEENAALMAMMYVRAGGKPTAVLATSGPGATNLATGIADAFMQQVPVIVLTGQVATSLFGMNADQEATGEEGNPDQVAMYRSMTKSSTLVIRPDAVARKVREAFRLAWSEPYGPVHVCIPSDVQAAGVEYEHLEPRQYRVTSFGQVDRDGVRRAADMLCSSKRPALIVGQRAMLPDASAEVSELADRCRIPVVTTVMGKGVLGEEHPYSLGVLHLYGHRLAERYLKEADCVMAAGESFMEHPCNYYERELVPAGGLIQIDSNAHQIGKIFPLALGVAGSVKGTLGALANELARRGYRSELTVEQLGRMKEETAHFREEAATSEAVPVKPQRLFWELSESLPAGAVVVAADLGKTFFWSLRYLRARLGAYLGSWGFLEMGGGAGGAAGVSFARPGVPVVCVCGDGSMQMNGMELTTAVQHRLPVTWVVFDDGRLNMVYMAQGICLGERYIATEMTVPDFAAWARAAGALGLTVERPEQIRPALMEAVASRGPCVIDLKIDADEMLPVKPRTVLMAKRMGLSLSDSKEASRAFRKVLDER